MSTVRIQVRRGLSSEWTTANPVLAAGEMGVETNTNLFKFGNGSTLWADLPYANNSDVAISEISQDAIAAALTLGSGLTKIYNDGSNKIHINVDTGVVATRDFATAEATSKADAAYGAAVEYTDDAISGVNNSLGDYIPVSDRGAQNGVASLNSSSKIPVEQIALNNFNGVISTSGNIFGDTITGANLVSEDLLTANDVNISGNLTIGGTTTTVNAVDLSISDPMIYLGEGNESNVLDLGFVASFDNGTYQHAGLVRDASDGIWKLFSGVTPEPTTVVDFTTYTKAPLEVGQLSATSAQIGAVGPQQIQMLSDVTSNIQAQIDAKLDHIPVNSVTSATIADGAVSSAKIENQAVTSNKIADEAVEMTKLAPMAVSTEKIATQSVTEEKIATDAVTTFKIADEAVTLSKLRYGAVDASKIVPGTIVDSLINANANIAQSKIEDLVSDLGLLAPKNNPEFTGDAEFTGTVVLPSATSIGDVSSTEINYLNGVTSSVQTQLTATATSLTNHESDTLNVHGIADTSLLATTGNVATAKGEAIDASENYTDSVIGALTKSSVGLANVDNTSDANKPVSTAQQAALDLKANLANPTFTGTVSLPAVNAAGNIVPTEDNTFDLGSPTKMWKDIYVGPGSLYVNGQKVLQDESGAIVVSADINENLGLRTSGSGNIEFDPTGTGSINIKGPVVVESGANFSAADGNGVAFSNGLMSDSLASRTSNTDLSLSGNGTGKVYINDNAEVSGNMHVVGNLSVSGTTYTVNAETISLADNIIDLNANFTTGTPTENAGLRIIRGDSNAVQVRWNESTDKWEFTNNGSDYFTIAPSESPTFTGTVNGITKSMVGLANVDNTSDSSKPISTATQTALDAKLGSSTAASTYAPIASPTFTGTVTVAASGVAFTDGAQTKQGVPSLTTIGTVIAGAYNLSTGGLALRDQLIPVSGAHAITVPTNATTAYPVGTSISFYQSAGSDASFVEASGVTILRTPGLKLRALHSSATITKVATDTWLLAGDLKA